MSIYVLGVGRPAPDGTGSQVGQMAGSYARRSAGQARQMEPTDPSAGARMSLAKALDPGETVLLVAGVVGSTLVLTVRRLLLVRDGAAFRPKTGVRSWVLDRELDLRLGAARGGASLLTIKRGDLTARVFITARQAEVAAALIAECRRLSYADNA